MLLNLRDLAAKETAVRFTESFDLSDLLGDRQDVAAFGILSGEFEAVSKSGVTEVNGRMSLPLELVCSRCLGPIEDTLDIPFREIFTQRPEAVSKDEAEDIHVVAADKVELKPYVEEAVWLALPHIPLCREECLGICPVCGKDRNTDPCDCRQDTTDPRLAGLADFFKSNNP